MILDAAQTPDEAPPGASPPRRPRRREGLVRSLLRNKKALAGLIILAVFILLALLAPVIAPGDPSLITSLGAQAPVARASLRDDVQGPGRART